MVVLKELVVCGGVFIDAHAENDAALRRNLLLQAIERLGFFDARRAPRCPEIEDHELAAQVRQVRRAWDLKCKIFGFAPARLASPWR